MAAKLALVVRTDLDMGRGKIAAQVAHAAVAAVLATSRSRDFAAWLAEGQPKVVLKVTSAEQLLDVARRARAARLPVELIQDAGRWSFLCVIAPLRLLGATGSPVNPIAIL